MGLNLFQYVEFVLLSSTSLPNVVCLCSSLSSTELLCSSKRDTHSKIIITIRKSLGLGRVEEWPGLFLSALMGSLLRSNPGVSEGAAFPLSPGHYAAARKETALMEADSARLGGVGG